MSTWTMDEVRSLTSEFNGGNLAALHNWLDSAPPFGGRYSGGSRPQKGSHIDVYKQFIVDCYEKGMFKATTPFVPPVGSSVSKLAVANAALIPTVQQVASVAAPIQAPAVNFFDDDSFDSAPIPRQTSAPVISRSVDPFFGSGMPSFHSAGNSPMAGTTSSTSSGFDFMNPQPTPPSSDFLGAQNTTSGSDFFFQPSQQNDFFSPPAAPAPQQSDDFFSQPAPQIQSTPPVSSVAANTTIDVFGSDFLTPFSSSSVGTVPTSANSYDSNVSSSRGGSMAISSMMSPTRSGTGGSMRGGTTSMGGRGPTDNFDFVRDSLYQQPRAGCGVGIGMGGAPQIRSTPMGQSMTHPIRQPMMQSMRQPPMMQPGFSHPTINSGSWGASPQHQGWGQR